MASSTPGRRTESSSSGSGIPPPPPTRCVAVLIVLEGRSVGGRMARRRYVWVSDDPLIFPELPHLGLDVLLDQLVERGQEVIVGRAATAALVAGRPHDQWSIWRCR